MKILELTLMDNKPVTLCIGSNTAILAHSKEGTNIFFAGEETAWHVKESYETVVAMLKD